MTVKQQQPPPSYEYNPPRPYAWKTDEFQAADPRAGKTQPINQVQPLTNQRGFTQPMTNYRQAPMGYNYRCPNCGTQNFPMIEKKISTAGWIVFGVLLVMFFPLFWIGLLIKEETKVCPICRARVG